jgi:hypothetical protein
MAIGFASLNVSSGRTLVAASSAKNGGFWRYQLCTEVARPTRFELLAPAFEEQGIPACDEV